MLFRSVGDRGVTPCFSYSHAQVTLVLTHARQVPTENRTLGRAVRIALSINKKRPVEFALDPRVDREIVLPFKKAERVRRIELTILERTGEGAYKDSAGFQEIALRSGD